MPVIGSSARKGANSLSPDQPIPAASPAQSHSDGSKEPPAKSDDHRGNFRSRHRSASHASAHAAAGALAPVPDHRLIPSGNAELITNDSALARLIDELRAAGTFAYDSEFIGEASYEPKLCLIQVATAQKLWLIDPLAGLSLQGFWELLCDASVQKIVHAGEQDVEPVVRHLNRAPANFFDTQIAAGMAGMIYPLALSKLVLELTAAKLGKGLTFTHWDQRPLSPMQMRYAADDVRYLPAVQSILRDRLRSLGHEAWLAAECDAMCQPSRYQFDPDMAVDRVRGGGSLGPAGAAVLRELVIWRNDAARDADLPPRSFLRDEVLVELSRNPAKSTDRLSRVRGLPRPVETQSGEHIVAATLRGLHSAEGIEKRPTLEPSPRQRFAADSLWAAAQCLAAGRQIDPSLLSSRQEIGELYRAASAGADLTDLRVMQSWRRAAVGDDLLALMAGKKGVSVVWRDGGLTNV